MTRMRRHCLAIAALGLALWTVAPRAAPPPRVKAVAFDYLALLDAGSIVRAIEAELPGRGREIADAWRTRQFEYGWLRALSGEYADFSQVTAEALSDTAAAEHLDLSPAARQRLLDAYRQLDAWPDTAAALRALRSSGVRVIVLANFSPSMLRANADHAGIDALLDDMVSTDGARTYKPDPKAYRLGTDRLHLAREDVLFVASAAWDAAGAKAFGYPTAWVNRGGQPMDLVGPHPDVIVSNLGSLVRFVLGEDAREEGLDTTHSGAHAGRRRTGVRAADNRHNLRPAR